MILPHEQKAVNHVGKDALTSKQKPASARLVRAELRRVLQYRNPDVVDRFHSQFAISRAEAQSIFRETLKWVWLCAEARHERTDGIHVPPLYIDRNLLVIDEMWHNFILFTQDYARFCEKHFAFFVHHNPTPPRKRTVRKEQLSSSDSAYTATRKARERQYSYIYDKLGAATLELWYSEWAQKYWNLKHR